MFPFFETILMVGKLELEEATKFRTMFLPPELPDRCTARFGEIAPSKSYFERSEAEPFWISFESDG